MRHLLQLAAAPLLTATTAHAQLHMPQLSHKEPKETREEVAWLAPYANPAPNGRESELVHDLRFKTFLRDHFTAPQVFWNDNESLVDTILEFLSVPNQVVLDANRHLSANSCVPHFSPPHVPPPTVGLGQAPSPQPKAQGPAPTEQPSNEAKKSPCPQIPPRRPPPRSPSPKKPGSSPPYPPPPASPPSSTSTSTSSMRSPA